MYYAYIIRSESSSSQTYVGYTTDLKTRLADHNRGHSSHTAKYCPWKLLFYSAFNAKQKALDFETYLKSHSGQAFAEKRLI